MTTGNGPSHLNEILGTMNSPGLSSTSFTAIEKEVGEWWLSALGLRIAADKIRSFCLQYRNGKLSLKENHDYYYQCQGLMNICGTEWIDFVVCTLNPYHLFIERIYRNEDLWNIMLPKLKDFYHTSLLPELASPREGKSPGIREPGVWCSASTRKWAVIPECA
uniref:Uncharacterized protein n=1 Tax=Magallana gigas TaxID=29159 RepID=A0A8W8IIT7_MAGGI